MSRCPESLPTEWKGLSHNLHQEKAACSSSSSVERIFPVKDAVLCMLIIFAKAL